MLSRSAASSETTEQGFVGHLFDHLAAGVSDPPELPFLAEVVENVPPLDLN